MRSRSGQKLKLTSVEELLGVPNEESAVEIDIVNIHSFKNHPFKVLDDEKINKLIDIVEEKLQRQIRKQKTKPGARSRCWLL